MHLSHQFVSLFHIISLNLALVLLKKVNIVDIGQKQTYSQTKLIQNKLSILWFILNSPLLQNGIKVSWSSNDPISGEKEDHLNPQDQHMPVSILDIPNIFHPFNAPVRHNLYKPHQHRPPRHSLVLDKQTSVINEIYPQLSPSIKRLKPLHCFQLTEYLDRYLFLISITKPCIPTYISST